jgi:4'-phosphopantetheinyl transferase EntD
MPRAGPVSAAISAPRLAVPQARSIHWSAARIDVRRFSWSDYRAYAVPPPVRHATMAPSRACEHLAGRVCAARALRALGSQAVRLAPGGVGPPVWPAGVVGSIAHSCELAVAVVCSRDALLSIGVDAEPLLSEPAIGEVMPLIAGRAELARLTDRLGDRSVAATLAFTAREAAFKCLSPIGRGFDEPRDAECCEVDPVRGAFTLRVRGPSPDVRSEQTVHGEFEVRAGHMFTVVGLTADLYLQ